MERKRRRDLGTPISPADSEQDELPIPRKGKSHMVELR